MVTALPMYRHLMPPAVALIVLAGCGHTGPWTSSVVWSPDGRHAAVIGGDGLYLADGQGRLSALLAADVYDAAWLADSQRLVLARTREINNWSALADALGPQRTDELAVKAEAVWQQIQAPGEPITLEDRLQALLEPSSQAEMGAILIHLRDHHGEALREKFGDRLDETDDVTVRLNELVIAQLTERSLEFAAPLHRDFSRIWEIRPSPDGRAVACVSEAAAFLSWSAGDLNILAVPVDGSSPAVVVAPPTAVSPDWTPQGRSLVYLDAAATETNGRRLGSLLERDVLDASGRIQLGEPKVLAGLIFEDSNRVRCLADGRVLFDAEEYHLPATTLVAHEQLFLVDRAQAMRPTLTPIIRRDQLDELPESLALFEVSPDSRQVLFAGDGEVLLLTLATGTIERFPQGDTGFDDPQLPLPVWRRPGEFSYVKHMGRNELVVRRGSSEIALSVSWPDRMLQRVSRWKMHTTLH
jgi:hypothetical protein